MISHLKNESGSHNPSKEGVFGHASKDINFIWLSSIKLIEYLYLN